MAHFSVCISGDTMGLPCASGVYQESPCLNITCWAQERMDGAAHIYGMTHSAEHGVQLSGQKVS